MSEIVTLVFRDDDARLRVKLSPYAVALARDEPERWLVVLSSLEQACLDQAIAIMRSREKFEREHQAEAERVGDLGRREGA